VSYQSLTVHKLISTLDELAAFVFRSVWRYSVARMDMSRRFDVRHLDPFTENSNALGDQGIAESLISFDNTSFKVLHEPLQSLSLLELLGM
jgi:hypothetical protein